MSRVEVISGPERRRQWSKEQKQAIVAEAFAPGASVSAVARRTDIGPGQIYRWRRELCSTVAGFAEVMVAQPPCESPEADAAAVEVALGADIRVREGCRISRLRRQQLCHGSGIVRRWRLRAGVNVCWTAPAVRGR